MKITKLIVSIALCISLMSNSSVYAAYDETPDSYFYVYPDGQTIEYYLDDYGNPYTYLNGEKIGVFITLDRYKVTDQKTIDMLNSNRNLADTNINRSEPTTYYDISNGQIYPLNVDFISVSTWASETLKCGSNSKKFRVRTLPYVQRPFAPKKSVAINIYYGSITNFM